MKTHIWMMATMLGLTLALAGCPKDEGTDSAVVPGTDSTVGVTDSGPGTDSAAVGTDSAVVMCEMMNNDCTGYCTAYLANCATDDNFPMNYDMPMCMTDCAALTQDLIDCRAYHACFSGKGGAAMADAHCDHAIGMMGFCM